MDDTPAVPREQHIHPEAMTPGQIVAADEARGATTHTFDPDASTAQKKAEAGAAIASLGLDAAKRVSPTGGAQELKVDTASANKPSPAPTITISDIEGASKGEVVATQTPTTSNVPSSSGASSTGELVGAEGVPGAIPAAPAGEIPDWYKVGWRAVSGIDTIPGGDLAAQDVSILSEWISETSYGKYYHNAGVIFFAVASAYFIGVFRLGSGWLLVVLGICAQYYVLSISRVRRSARDDIQRELVKTRLVTESESADWINSFLARFWRIYEPILSATIVASVDAVLSTSTPAFLESIKMTTFTLGNKAPRIESVRTFPKTEEDIVIMDWKISFTPTDVSDVTPREQKFQTNPKIVLEIKVGKGFISAPIPILLEDICFSGLMRIRLKLITTFPHIQIVEMSFLERPIFDYVLKPIGGEMLGFDIASIPGLSGFVREQVHATLGPMMYDPNVFTLNLEQLLSGAPLDTAIGVLQLTMHSARNIKGSKLGGGTPDPYVSISLAGKAEAARTKHKESTYNPQWSEVKFILVNSLSDILSLAVWDHNSNRKDSELGVANFELARLKEDAEQEGLTVNILKEGKERGELRFDAKFYPVLKPQKLADGTLDAVPETRTGICRLTIHQAKELDGSRLIGMGQGVNPFARVFVGGSKEPIHKTGIFKNNFSPSWESSTEFIVTDKSSSVVSVQVIDDRDFAKDPILGRLSISLKDLLAAKEKQVDWFPLTGCSTGRIRLSAEWKPLAMAGSVNGSAAYVPPIGILRVHFKKAIDVKNVEGALGGKSDPYVRVLNAGNTMGRTEVVNNNLNPEWDAFVYVPVHSMSERPIFEVMDYQNLTKDRSLGTVECDLRLLASQTGDNRTPFLSKGPQSRRDKIKLDGKGSFKGELVYDIEFCPAVNLLGGVSFEPKEDAVSEAVHQADGHTNGNGQPPMTPTSPTSPTNGETPNERAGSGVALTRQDFLSTQSGVLVIQAISGTIEKKSRLEVLFDDGYWPSFGTDKSQTTHAKWDRVGEAFVKELDLSRITIRLNENDEFEKEDIVAQLQMDGRLFVEQCLDTPKDFTLLAADGSGRRSVVKMCCKLVPVDIKLQARESANNQGTLQVTLVDGADMKGADRSGKSDPYAVFTLGGEKIFKSEVKKKTLAPIWDEKFEVDIPSRVAAQFNVEVFDWNQLEQAKSLGTATIDLAGLEPFEMHEESYVLSSKSGGKGHVRLRLVFQPAIIVRTRKNTSTFSTAGRAAGQVAHLPLGVATGVGKGVFHGVGAVGAGVGAVGGFAGRKIGLVKKKDKSGKEILVEEPIEGNGSMSGLNDAGLPDPSSPTSTDFAGNGSSFSQNGTPPDGFLTVTVLSAQDLVEEVKSHVVVSMGSKSLKTSHSSHKSTAPEWDEPLKFTTSSESRTVTFAVTEHKTLGKDKVMGVGEIELWKKISPAMPSTDCLIPLREGTGQLKVRLEWRSTPVGGSIHSVNPSSPAPSRRSLSSKSPSKFLSRKADDSAE